MHRRHPLPRTWLMTDERMGDALWLALERLPRGSGVVFRHHATPIGERRILFARVLQVARRRRLVLLRAGRTQMRGEMGVHGARGRGLVTRAVHDRAEAIAARRAGGNAVFVSPVFATRSHPGARELGAVRLGLLLRVIRVPAIALGGMDTAAMRRLRGLRIHGWAGIDGWLAVDGQRWSNSHSVRTGTRFPHTPPGCRGDGRSAAAGAGDPDRCDSARQR